MAAAGAMIEIEIEIEIAAGAMTVGAAGAMIEEDAMTGRGAMTGDAVAGATSAAPTQRQQPWLRWWRESGFRNQC